MDFSTNMRLKTINADCDVCGQPFTANVPDFVETTKCDPCILKHQQEQDKKRRLYAIRDSAEHCGIPAKYREWNDQTAQKLGNDKLLSWMQAKEDTESIWIGGTNGIGKTHAVLFRAYQLLIENNIHSYCVRASSWLRRTVTDRTKDKNGDKAYLRAISARLLVFDDMGKERLSEARGELLYDIIDERDRRDLPIWITTNFTGQALMERMNAASGDESGHESGHEYGYAIMKRLTRMIPKENIWK